MVEVTAKVINADMNFVPDSWPRSGEKPNVFDVMGEPHTIPITDARTLEVAPSIATQGFALLHCPTTVQDFSNTEEVDQKYRTEMCEFIKEMTGADCVVPVGSHLLRFGNRMSPDQLGPGMVAPGLMAHSDVTEASAADFIRDFPPTENRKIRRAMQHNIWRAFSEGPQDKPLAVCDANTLDPEDMLIAEYKSAPTERDNLQFDVILMRHNPKQNWYFYSNMNRDEALIFKRHDTQADANGVVAHGAFIHPEATTDWTPRASIEFRTMAYWYE